MTRWLIAVFILPPERLIERWSHLENHRACPRQWFVVDESKASRPNHPSKHWPVMRSRFAASRSSEMPGEAIGQSILWAREKIKGRLRADEETAFAPASHCKQRDEFAHTARSRQWRKETSNARPGCEISRKNSDETDVLLSPVKTASPRKEERSFGAHRRRFVVKVETDTQGSILDHLDIHSNVRQTFRDIIFRLHARGTFTLSIKRDLLPTWHRVSLKNGNSGAEIWKMLKNRQYRKLTFWIIF